jgi:hypothetical protein
MWAQGRTALVVVKRWRGEPWFSFETLVHEESFDLIGPSRSPDGQAAVICLFERTQTGILPRLRQLSRSGRRMYIRPADACHLRKYDYTGRRAVSAMSRQRRRGTCRVQICKFGHDIESAAARTSLRQSMWPKGLPMPNGAFWNRAGYVRERVAQGPSRGWT